MPDRGTFFKEVASTLDFLLLHPASEMQKNATLIIAGLVLVIALSKFHKWGRAARSGFLISLAVTAISLFFLMTVFVWSGQGVDKLGLVSGQEMAVLAIVMGIAFFAGVAPWTRFCFKSAYFTSVAAWILAACVAAGSIYLCQWGWETADKGSRKSSSTLQVK